MTSKKFTGFRLSSQEKEMLDSVRELFGDKLSHSQIVVMGLEGLNELARQVCRHTSDPAERLLLFEWIRTTRNRLCDHDTRRGLEILRGAWRKFRQHDYQEQVSRAAEFLMGGQEERIEMAQPDLVERPPRLLDEEDTWQRLLADVTGRQIKLYISEEQELLRESYWSYFLPQHDVEIVGFSSEISGETLAQVPGMQPDVIMVGRKVVQPDLVERLGELMEACGGASLVVLASQYTAKGARALRTLGTSSGGGRAYLLKQNVDSMDELADIVRSVARGRVTIDASVMEGMLSAGEQAALLRELSSQEMEVLGWMAKGYHDEVIAEVMGLATGSVQRQINSIYNKLGVSAEPEYARVRAVTMYLKTLGSTLS